MHHKNKFLPTLTNQFNVFQNSSKIGRCIFLFLSISVLASCLTRLLQRNVIPISISKISQNKCYRVRFLEAFWKDLKSLLTRSDNIIEPTKWKFIQVNQTYTNRSKVFLKIYICLFFDISDTFGHPDCLVFDSCGYFYMPRRPMGLFGLNVLLFCLFDHSWLGWFHPRRYTRTTSETTLQSLHHLWV